jgi:hypothetical protein
MFGKMDRYVQLGEGLHGAAAAVVMRRRLLLHEFEHEGSSAHSLRSGPVTAAAKAEVPTSAIQRQAGIARRAQCTGTYGGSHPSRECF